MGWLSVLGTIGGAALAPFTGGASLAIGSALGGAADAAMAEKKGASQAAGGARDAATVLQPYNQIGLRNAGTLSQLLGVDTTGIDLSGALPFAGSGGAPTGTRMTHQDFARQQAANGAYEDGPSHTDEVQARRPLSGGGTLAGLTGHQNPNATSSYGATVRLQSPDGTEVDDVPVHLLEKALAAGARRVS